jgi:hypothetical protein
MYLFRRALIAALLATSAIPTLPSLALAQACTCAGAGIRAERAPPPLPDYDQPPLPAEGYIWTPGYWAWNNVDYYWVPGTWAEPPRPGLLWTPGYWSFVNGVYAFNPGYWAPHVGFYGGVDYGYGYFGAGYQGGRWNNGAFVYNSAANNFANVHIVNIYEEKIVENAPAERVSFNGGNGGLAARPTAAEEMTFRGPHENPTKAQFEHLRAASVNAESFETTNHGRPPVAATPRPGAFTDRDVIKAKPPGKPELKGESQPKAGDQKPPVGNPAPTPEKPALKNAPNLPPRLNEEKPGAERPLGKPLNDRAPAPDAEPMQQRPRMERQPAPDAQPMQQQRPRIERQPAPDAEPMQQHPRMERRPEPEPEAGRPQGAGEERERPRQEKRECGHPGEPACR